MQRGFPCSVKSMKLPFSQLLLRLLVRLSSSQLWARLSVKQHREGGGDCFSPCALYGSTVKESAQPSPLLPHPLIHKGKRWECQKQTLNMEIAMHTERCSHPIPTITDTNQQITALWSQQLVQSPNTAAYSSSKHTQTLPHAGILQSIQSVSVVISIIYSKLFLELAEIRPSLCPNTAEAHLCTREHLLWLCKSEGCDGGVPSSLVYTVRLTEA